MIVEENRNQKLCLRPSKSDFPFKHPSGELNNQVWSS